MLCINSVKRFFSVFFILLATSIANGAWAGSKQVSQIQHQPEDVVKFAKNIEKYAAGKGARAFLIARVGRPKKDLPKGIQFTHTAIAIYSAITLNSGQVVNGYAIHNLYQDTENKKRSSLITDYPVDFFWGAYELTAGIVIPTPQIQQQLIDIISRGDNKILHNPKYSVIANPYNSQYQNCTEHTLDIVNAAIYNTTNVAQLKANTKAHYSAQRIKSSRFKLMLGALLMDDITTSDHKGKVKTTTFTSIANYLNRYELAQHSVSLNQDLVATEI